MHFICTVTYFDSVPFQGDCRISVHLETITNQRWPRAGNCAARDNIRENVH